MCIIVYNKKQGGEDYMNLAYKILNAHLKEGELVPGTSICIGDRYPYRPDTYSGRNRYNGLSSVRSNECRSCCSRKSRGLY